MNFCFFVLATLLTGVLSQDGNKPNPCIGAESQKSCGACIATHKSCGWCAAPDFDKDSSRLQCDTVQNHLDWNCNEADIQSPEIELYKLENLNVQDGDNPEDAVQLQPQKVKLKIRPNTPVRIPLTFRQAANYPVDLYYLMDLSNSMEDDKDNLAELGNIIAQQMSAITKNFRLGFGSFVDKVVSPFVSTVPAKLKEPCRLVWSEGVCVAPYGFQNQLSLDLETSKFAKKVRAAKVSGNLDAPEGGFDAIMQAVTCEAEIGWRSISRRMLVFSTDAGFHTAGDGKQAIGWRNLSRRMLLVSTDAGFHTAGDGKLGGIVTPNDGKCHMVNNIYTESSNQDYPSISQVASKIKEKAVSVIFAVTEDQVPIYSALSGYIEGSTTGALANDSSNIVNLIQENYEKITSKVSLRAQNLGNNMTVKFYSRCKGSEQKLTHECDKLSIGDSVDFDVELTVTECPKDRNRWRQELEIQPVGYQEKLLLDVHLACECECEKPENEEKNSPKCSDGKGTFECGKCTCDPGYYGKQCECKADDPSSQKSLKQCIKPGSTVPCSAQGNCVCGVCECNSLPSNPRYKYSGDYCECNDYSCGTYDGLLCGGLARGKCHCGACECNPSFTGSYCECNLNKTDCMTDEGLECNGHGTCDCGECICVDPWSGIKCEHCFSQECTNKKCVQYMKCVECSLGEPTQEEKDQCILDRCPAVITEVDRLEIEDDVVLCKQEDKKKCTRTFTYEYDNFNEVIIKVRKDKVCPESVNGMAIVGGVIGGIVAVGLLLLLLWKLLTFIYDTREFAKFEKERQNAKWDTGENPIYKQATSTFKNPTYGAH